MPYVCDNSFQIAQKSHDEKLLKMFLFDAKFIVQADRWLFTKHLRDREHMIRTMDLLSDSKCLFETIYHVSLLKQSIAQKFVFQHEITQTVIRLQQEIWAKQFRDMSI